MAKAGQQGAEGQHRGAHGFHQFVRGFGVVQPTRIQTDRAVIGTLGGDAHVADELEHGGHILQLWHVVQGHGLIGQQGRAQLGQGRIFSARNQHFALEWTTATD